MIPGAFDYHRPESVSEAVALLIGLGEEARPLAGGHSLVPLMKTRLASPEHLVDLSSIANLKGVRREGDDVVIGAMTTQHQLIASDLLCETIPLLREVSLMIADPQVRYRGTLGGNVANGDPGNDMPAVMQCLDAQFEIAGQSGDRRVAARDFYLGAYTTTLEPGEILTGIRIKIPPGGHGFAYVLRDNGFVIGLAELRDALIVMSSASAAFASRFRAALRALFCSRQSDWRKFDDLFDAYWRAKRSATRVFGAPQKAPSGLRSERSNFKAATTPRLRMSRAVKVKTARPARAKAKAPRARNCWRRRISDISRGPKISPRRMSWWRSWRKRCAPG
jgi:CO/xanthine dehydrogenase FAD-binding subunit